MGFWQNLQTMLFGAADDGARDSRDASAVATQPQPQPPLDEDAEAEGIWWIPDPQRVSAASASSSPDRLASQISRRLGTIIDDPNLDLPHLPRTADRAMIALRGNDADYSRLAKIVEEDPAIAARILRVANSVAFRGMSEVRQLESAFARLGQRQLRQIILTASLQSVSIQLGSGKEKLGETLWREALAGGVIAGAIGPRCGFDANDAFLYGLLHDIGNFVVLSVAHEVARRSGGHVPREVFDKVSLEWHEHAGLRLASAWDLPDPLPDLVSRHHRLPESDDPLRRERMLVMTTDVVGALLEYRPYHPYDFFSTPCVRELKITDDAETRAFLRTLPTLIAERTNLAD